VTLLDTSVIIDFLVGDEKIIAIVKEILTKESIRTTTITEYELLRYKSKIRKHAAERFLSGATVISFDRTAAKESAQLFEELQIAGKMINENDLLIAGISLVKNEILLTRDKKLGDTGKDNIKLV
jgi:predicted nucleic acid-binding protein